MTFITASWEVVVWDYTSQVEARPREARAAIEGGPARVLVRTCPGTEG